MKVEPSENECVVPLELPLMWARTTVARISPFRSRAEWTVDVSVPLDPDDLTRELPESATVAVAAAFRLVPAVVLLSKRPLG